MTNPAPVLTLTVVLVVDDDEHCRSLLTDLLKSAGYSVMTAENGPQALRALRFAVRKPSLCVVDYMMPLMNGFELIRAIRQNEDHRNTPVIMLTASNKELRESVELEGVFYQNKSCSNRDIIDRVRRVLGEAANAPPKQEQVQAPPKALEIIRNFYFPDEPITAMNAKSEPNVDTERRRPSARAGRSGSSEAFKRESTVRPEPSSTEAEREVSRILRSLETSMDAPAESPSSAKAETEKPVLRNATPAPTADVPGKQGKTDVPTPPAVPPQPPRLSTVARRPAPRPEESFEHGAAKRRQETAPAEDESSVIALVEALIKAAIERQASDIHLEPNENGMSVRLRVDGALQPLKRIPAEWKAAVVARIKVLSELDITERRLPQDGHFNAQDTAGRKVQFRVSTLPSLYGEKIVMRVLRSGKLRTKLEALALSKDDQETLDAALRTSNGLILVTGPTGSGKTTTLYGMIDRLNQPHRNIVTVEDPVEYECEGVTQVQVHSEIGYTFERVLRSLLRQDPNVILVGEIRDAETAAMALKAAVTGHMVLSTLHTNDAPSTLQRLISMGVPSYLVAAACRLVIAQRLLRRLCLYCRKPDHLRADESALLTDKERERLSRVWRAKGCDRCHGIGYSGRQAVLEMMSVSHPLRQAIIEQASPEALRAIASGEGMRSLRQEALDLVAAGATSPEEALTVLYAA